MIRLYPDKPAPAKTIRLYSDSPKVAAPQNAAPSSTPPAPTALSAKTPIPQGAPTSTDGYFRGKGYGASNITDSSGRPLLTFKNDTAKQSQLLKNRVATMWDPTVPTKIDRKMLVNGRIPVEVSNAIREELGADYDDELDHRIALSLGGSNQKSNLGLEPGRTTKGRAAELNKLVNQLSREASSGKISLLDAQRRIAEAKGVKLPDIGAKPFVPEPVSKAPPRRSVTPAPVPAPAPQTTNEFRQSTDFKTVPRPGEPAKPVSSKLKKTARDFAAGFVSSPEEQRTDPRFGELGQLTPYGLGAGIGMLGAADEIAKAPKAAKNLAKKAINVARLTITPEARRTVEKTAEEIAPVLSKLKGAPLKNDEVIEAAITSDMLRKATTREATLKSEAALFKTRQHLSALAEGKVTPEFVDTLRVVSAEATRRGRELQALGIGADPSLNTVKFRILKQLVELGQSTDDIVKRAEGVDFTNAKQVTEFYRSFVKPTLPEIIDEFRYINLLSSPRTHIVNAFSNILQATVLRPATRLASGAIDNVASKRTRKEQDYYIRQVPAYYRGAVSSFGEATSKALSALRGNALIERPDLARIPTGSKALKPFQFVPRLLEASDVFFRTLVESGEREALALKYRKAGKEVNAADVATEASKIAEETVFRKAIDPSNATGQGVLLSRIDSLTNAVYRFRSVPSVKWFIPFVQTPMNILKQGIEYSPLGVATLPGNARKIEQLSKAAVGSMVFAGAGALALEGRTTWSVPASPKDRDAFYAAGLQPYAVKVGDTWMSYSKLGPLAYPIAMAAAIQHYTKENPKAATDTRMQKLTKIMTGVAEFFADQSYMQGMGDILDVARGDETAAARIFSNVPTQLVPLSSLLRWTSTIIDPVYRKADRELSPRAVIENIKKGLPGFSKSLESYETPSGDPSLRQKPVLNSFSPVQISEETPAVGDYQERMRKARERALKAKNNDQ